MWTEIIRDTAHVYGKGFREYLRKFNKKTDTRRRSDTENLRCSMSMRGENGAVF